MSFTLHCVDLLVRRHLQSESCLVHVVVRRYLFSSLSLVARPPAPDYGKLPLIEKLLVSHVLLWVATATTLSVLNKITAPPFDAKSGWRETFHICGGGGKIFRWKSDPRLPSLADAVFLTRCRRSCLHIQQFHIKAVLSRHSPDNVDLPQKWRKQSSYSLAPPFMGNRI